MRALCRSARIGLRSFVQTVTYTIIGVLELLTNSLMNWMRTTNVIHIWRNDLRGVPKFWDGTEPIPPMSVYVWDGTAPVPPMDFVILPHICSMMLSPNCEHLISVAPSIKRAKS